MIRVLIYIYLLFCYVTFCYADNGPYFHDEVVSRTPTSEEKTEGNNIKSKEVCLSKSGNWFEEEGYKYCLIPYKDAGKLCKSSADCLGNCLWPLDDKTLDGKLLNKKSGICQLDDSTGDCGRPHFENGEIIFFSCDAGVVQDIPEEDTSLTSGLVYGENHAFFIQAPKGWVLDNESGVDNGSHAVFYPKGGSWEESDSVMYVNTIRKDLNKPKSIKEVVKEDIDKFKSEMPTLQVSDKGIIRTGDGKEAIVKDFIGESPNNFEEVAYIDEKEVVVVIVASSVTKEGLEDSLGAFNELISSYKFRGDLKIIDKKKGIE